MRVTLILLLALFATPFDGDGAYAQEAHYGICGFHARLAAVALRSDGVIGIALSSPSDEATSVGWSDFSDYSSQRLCGPSGIEESVTTMCEQFLTKNEVNICASQLTEGEKQITAQAKEIRRLSRENKKLRARLRKAR